MKLSSTNKKSKAQLKKDLEDKIVQLEGKLSELSNQLGKVPERRNSSEENFRKTPPNYRFLTDAAKRGIVKLSSSDDRLISSLDPDGSAIRQLQLLAIAEQNYQDQLKKRGGTLPKGFGLGEPESTYKRIMSYNKSYARILFKSRRCLGCKRDLYKRHVNLCYECANEKLNDIEFNEVIKKFTGWGLYEKPFFTKIALKLKLAKVVMEHK